MHIHHNPMTPGNSGVHSAGAAEKAAAAQRAADTRRKLRKNAAQADSTLDAEVPFWAARWSNEHPGEREKQPRRERQKNQPDDEGSAATPISVWA